MSAIPNKLEINRQYNHHLRAPPDSKIMYIMVDWQAIHELYTKLPRTMCTNPLHQFECKQAAPM